MAKLAAEEQHVSMSMGPLTDKIDVVKHLKIFVVWQFS